MLRLLLKQKHKTPLDLRSEHTELNLQAITDAHNSMMVATGGNPF
jgi:hypothetical protein